MNKTINDQLFLLLGDRLDKIFQANLDCSRMDVFHVRNNFSFILWDCLRNKIGFHVELDPWLRSR